MENIRQMLINYEIHFLVKEIEATEFYQELHYETLKNPEILREHHFDQKFVIVQKISMN